VSTHKRSRLSFAEVTLIPANPLLLPGMMTFDVAVRRDLGVGCASIPPRGFCSTEDVKPG
jgi:hypothetical protein